MTLLDVNGSNKVHQPNTSHVWCLGTVLPSSGTSDCFSATAKSYAGPSWHAEWNRAIIGVAQHFKPNNNENNELWSTHQGT